MIDFSLFRDFVSIKIRRYNLSQIKNGILSTDIKSSLDNGSLNPDDLRGKIVFDSLCEGHGAREMSAVLDSLCHYDWYDPNKIVFLHNSLDLIPPGIKHVSWPWYMVNHCDWLHNLQKLEFDWDRHVKNRWFLCIMRRRSMQRSMFLKKILDNFDNSHCRLSYASMIDYRVFDDIAGINIPMLLDGPTPGEEQHRASDHRIFDCLVNVIVETSCQEPGDNHWNSLFITEKTFKCFGWRQIPIWFATPGSVQEIRNMGFDVFDDFVDHDNYDKILDPAKRMAAVIETLKNFIESASGPVDYVHQEVKMRLEKNWQKLIQLDREKLPHWATIMEKINEL